MTNNHENFEIERKYLLASLPENLEEYPSKKIKQAYISTKPTIRIRKQDDEYILTVKGSGQIKKIEYELFISKEEFKNLLEKTEGYIIKKTRYLIPIHNDLTAELDVYHKDLDGLYTVEVEFTSEEAYENFTPPSWFGKDVSLDKHYKNTSLSKHGLNKIGDNL